MANPIFYVDQAAAESYPIVGDDPTERRGWGVRPMVGSELAVFPSRHQAEDHARQFDQGEVVEVDVIVGHALTWWPHYVPLSRERRFTAACDTRRSAACDQAARLSLRVASLRRGSSSRGRTESDCHRRRAIFQSMSARATLGKGDPDDDDLAVRIPTPDDEDLQAIAGLGALTEEELREAARELGVEHFEDRDVWLPQPWAAILRSREAGGSTVHVKLGDRVRTPSGRYGIVTSISEQSSGKWIVYVDVEGDSEAESRSALPYADADLIIIRPTD